MDPDETLRLWNIARNRALDAEDNDSAVPYWLEADGHMSDLIDWLAKGGFQPDWSRYQ